MKRILSSIVVLLIFFSCSINCYAAEYKETRTGDVYGKYNFYSNEGIYTAISSDGSYEVITDDDVRIMITSSNSDLILAVHQITKNDNECYKWFESCVSPTVTNFTPYDIFFIDATGSRIELSADNEIKISVLKSTQYVLGLSYDGIVTAISYSIDDGFVTFDAADIHAGYYLLCDKIGHVPSPQTGDTCNIFLQFTTLIASGGVFVFFMVVSRRKEIVQ